jgi:protein phosphatase
VAIGSVGDSRLYLFANGALEQVTQDDTWAATILAQDPDMRMEDIANHPMRNVLTNVLGGRPTVEVRMAERELRGGETLVLCSDGVHGVLDEARIVEILQRRDDVNAIAQAIVDAALERGSRDNVTALVVRYEAGSET